MKVAVIYRAFSVEDIERAYLSAKMLKDFSKDTSIECIMTYNSDNVSIEDSLINKYDSLNFLPLDNYGYIEFLSGLISLDFDYICTSSCDTVFTKSLDDLFLRLNSLTSTWQILGNVEFTPFTMDNGTNFEIAEDIEDVFIDSRFCIINPRFAHDQILDYFLYVANGIDDLDSEESQFAIETIMGDTKDVFYNILSIVINALNSNRIVCPEIVYDSGYNIDDIRNGLVYVIFPITLNQENGLYYQNCHICLYDVKKYVEENNIDLSKDYKDALDEYCLLLLGIDLGIKHKLERLEGKVALQECELIVQNIQ